MALDEHIALTLKQELKEIGQLRSDLGAVIVLQEAKSHPEFYLSNNSMASYMGRGTDPVIEINVTDTPQIDRPDEHKRGEARARLEYLSKASPYFLGRFMAGRTLGYSVADFLKQEYSILRK